MLALLTKDQETLRSVWLAGGNRKEFWNENKYEQIKSNEYIMNIRTYANNTGNKELRMLTNGGSLVVEDAYHTKEIISRVAMAKSVFTKMKSLFTSSLNLELKKLIKFHISSIALYGALRKL